MKIGILTYHRAHNYGAILQAIATRVVLQQMGHEVYYVDYWPNYHKNMYNVFSVEKFKKFGLTGKINYIKLLILKFSKIIKRRHRFEDFIKRYIDPYCKSEYESYDIIVIGSDQVWRRQNSLNDYNPVYFGHNQFIAKKQVTYAASMGILPKNNIEKSRLKELLANTNKFSVREQSLQELLIQMGKDAMLHLDPTLLLSKSDWDNLLQPINIEEEYVLFYNFQKGAFEEEKIRKFSKVIGCSLKIIVGGVRLGESEEENNIAGPFEFIQLIRNAKYIFTSSFHGLVFSLIYNKQFFASYTHNSGRAESLLSSLGLQDRLLSPCSEIPFDVKDIDFENVNESMEFLKESSYDYLLHLSI